MTRVKISIGIVAALVTFSVFSGIWVRSRCSELAEQAWSAAETVTRGEDAADELSELCRSWERFRRGAGLLLRNDRLTEIDRLCARLESESGTAALADLAELRRLLILIRN